MSKKKQGNKQESPVTHMDMKSQRMQLQSILKDIEYMGPSHMTWKQKKDLENKKVVSLGGKPPKKQRLPLSVARVQMKKQKEREQKMLQENMILGQVGGKHGNRTKRTADSRKPEHRVFKSTAGRFRNGVLDVKNLLQPAAASRDTSVADSHGFGQRKGGKRKGGKKNQGKKGGRRKGH